MQSVAREQRALSVGKAEFPPRLGPRPLLQFVRTALAGAADNARAGARLEAFLAGLRAYRRHPYRRPPGALAVEARIGRLELLAAGPAHGPPLLLVPSLVNRGYILDLQPGNSLAAMLAAAGYRVHLADWRPPTGAAELALDLEAHITGLLTRALDHVLARHGRPVLLGYCMGGLLALGLTALRPDAVRALGLLATPWDYRAMVRPRWIRERAAEQLAAAAAANGHLPAQALQWAFAQAEPQRVVERYAAFAALDPASLAARRFVAIEDWLHDGMALPGPAAIDVLLGWYVRNLPAAGRWRIGGTPVRPERLRLPVLGVVPRHDRIVPPAAARPLIDALPAATLLEPPAGHVGMVAGGRAETLLWSPLRDWLAAMTGAARGTGRTG